VIGEGRLEKHIVQSRFKLSYEVVQNIITGNFDHKEFNQKYPCTPEEFANLQEKLLNLTQIATAHRQQRILFEVFENREMEFKTDETNWPIECFIDKRYTAKKVVE
jgi:exoribonuclease R